MPGLLRGMARTAAVVGTAQATRGRVARRQQQRWSSDDQAQYVQQQPAPAPQVRYAAPPTPAVDPLEQLERLAALKSQGILTDAEFEGQKQKILAA